MNFIIGRSNERNDWNYAQVNVQDAAGKWVGVPWNVLFELPAAPKGGTATLRIGLASSNNAKLSILLNGKAIGSFRTAADNAMIRAGIHGQYDLEEISFDASILQNGKNTLTLQQLANENVQKSVMYDALRLELNEEQAYVPAPKKSRKPSPEVAPAKEEED